jgi:hypothetical protein
MTTKTRYGGRKDVSNRKTAKKPSWLNFVKRTHGECKNRRGWSFSDSLKEAGKRWRKLRGGDKLPVDAVPDAPVTDAPVTGDAVTDAPVTVDAVTDAPVTVDESNGALPPVTASKGGKKSQKNKTRKSKR